MRLNVQVDRPHLLEELTRTKDYWVLKPDKPELIEQAA